MSRRLILIIATISGFLSVAFGAFGAHVLSVRLGGTEMAWINTGLQYQGLHTLVLLVMGMGEITSRWWRWSGALIAVGMMLFSGGLYCLALTHLKYLVYAIPVGGGCFLLGWACMLTGVLQMKKGSLGHE